MTNFAFEVPLAHVKDFEPYQDFIFGLSFLLIDPTYSEYIVDHCVSGLKDVFIDNSFNETQVPVDAGFVADLYTSYLPTAVAAPDADVWESEIVIAEYERLRRLIPPDGILGIFKNWKEYNHLVTRGCTYKAVSYWWRDKCGSWLSAQNCHFLGLGDLQEVVGWQPRTLDTSIPIKMAIKGIALEDWSGIYIKPQGEQLRGDFRLQRAWDYFNIRLTDAQLDLAVHNIQALKATVNASSLV